MPEGLESSNPFGIITDLDEALCVTREVLQEARGDQPQLVSGLRPIMHDIEGHRVDPRIAQISLLHLKATDEVGFSELGDVQFPPELPQA